MKILNLGSLNIDKTYSVEHFVQPGETMTANNLEIFCGGKGLNQSIALAAAGADVRHLGCIGCDGDFLVDMLSSHGVNTEAVTKINDSQNGHAIIQVDRNGQNCIMLFSGTNRCIKEEWIDRELKNYSAGDWLLIQNETNCLEYAMRAAYERGLKIAFNPSPMDEKVLTLPLELVKLFLINEVEGSALTGKDNPKDILLDLKKRFPNASFLLTLGKNGSIFENHYNSILQPSYTGTVKDTTGAGDTYTGFFLANYIKGVPPHDCMRIATTASTIQISREGAAAAIPTYDEVNTALKNIK